MTTLATMVDPASEAFAANAAHNRALADDLRAKVATAALGGSAQHRDRHVARGKLLPRDRSTGSSIPARRSWKWARLPPTACTTMRLRVPA